MTAQQRPSPPSKEEVQDAVHDIARLTLGAVSDAPDTARAAIEALRARLQALCRARYAALLRVEDGREVGVVDDEPDARPRPPQARLSGGAEAKEAGLLTALSAQDVREGRDDLGCWLSYPLPLRSDDRVDAPTPRIPHALLVLGWPRDRDGCTEAAEANAILPVLAPVAGAVIAAHLLSRRARTFDLAGKVRPPTDEHSGARDEWEQVFDAVSEPICVLTPDYRVVRANRAYARLFGLEAAHFAGHRCYDATRGQESPCDDCPLPQTLATAGPAGGRKVRHTSTGLDGAALRRLFEVWTYPVRDASGVVVRIVEILKDVTEQEQVRQAQSEAEALRRADHLKAELLGTVSHELRSPLAAIKGYAETLRRHERRLSSAERHDFLEAIDVASDRLARIIDRLLEMSQLETGSIRLDIAPVDLARTARLALAAAEAEAGRDGDPRHTFALRVLDGTGRATEGSLLVAGDARLLREVADILLENAVKYSPDGGAVEVTLRPAPSPALGHSDTGESAGDAAEEGGAAPAHAGMPHVELIVRDRGIGIPPEHLGRIFDRFHRVDTRLTRAAGGLGLGLALARRIVDLHGGAIWAESEPGSGSAFHVLLPAADEAAGDIGASSGGA